MEEKWKETEKKGGDERGEVKESGGEEKRENSHIGSNILCH